MAWKSAIKVGQRDAFTLSWLPDTVSIRLHMPVFNAFRANKLLHFFCEPSHPLALLVERPSFHR